MAFRFLKWRWNRKPASDNRGMAITHVEIPYSWLTEFDKAWILSAHELGKIANKNWHEPMRVVSKMVPPAINLKSNAPAQTCEVEDLYPQVANIFNERSLQTIGKEIFGASELADLKKIVNRAINSNIGPRRDRRLQLIRNWRAGLTPEDEQELLRLLREVNDSWKNIFDQFEKKYICAIGFTAEETAALEYEAQTILIFGCVDTIKILDFRERPK